MEVQSKRATHNQTFLSDASTSQSPGKQWANQTEDQILLSRQQLNGTSGGLLGSQAQDHLPW